MPRTMVEWVAYVRALDAAALGRKARAINHIDVVERLLADGLSPDELETVYVLFAQRLQASGAAIPDGGLYDWRSLAAREPPLPLPPDDGGPAAADGDDDELAALWRT